MTHPSTLTGLREEYHSARTVRRTISRALRRAVSALDWRAVVALGGIYGGVIAAERAARAALLAAREAS